jgi:hypothetical protein
LVGLNDFTYFQAVTIEIVGHAEEYDGLYRKWASFIFFCGLFYLGVYNRRKVKTVGGSDSILFNFRKEVW